MKRPVASLVTVLALAAPAGAEPSNTLRDMYARLRGCISTIAVAPGTDVTVQFALNRRGALIGEPRLTHVVWPKDADERKAGAAIASGFDRCLPVSITDALGGAIAGRLFFYRIHRPGPAERKA